MAQETIFLTILGMMAVTYAPRVLPVWVLASKRLPRVVVAWLRQVPVAVLAAMLFPVLLVRGSGVDLGLDNLFLWAAIPTLVVIGRRQSFFGAVVVGMLVVALARLVLGV